MRRLELALLSLLACCLTSCAANSSAELTAGAADPAADAANWQGTWNLVSCMCNGQPEEFSDVQWIVSGDHYNIRLDGKTGTDPYTFTLDAKAKQIDVFHHDTPKGTFGGKWKGIYEIQEDSLKVCYELTGQRYPTSFDAGPGTRQVLYEFQREGR